jgi:Protein of unknown function (DUF3562)
VAEPAHLISKTNRDESAVAALAQKTHTPIEVVKHLYDEELADLQANSAVKSFIDVIAGRRVKERLRRSPSRRAKRADPGTLPQ